MCELLTSAIKKGAGMRRRERLTSLVLAGECNREEEIRQVNRGGSDCLDIKV
jgi:hypothetical protein